VSADGYEPFRIPKVNRAVARGKHPMATDPGRWTDALGASAVGPSTLALLTNAFTSRRSTHCRIDLWPDSESWACSSRASLLAPG
jgi:allantoicase